MYCCYGNSLIMQYICLHRQPENNESIEITCNTYILLITWLNSFPMKKYRQISRYVMYFLHFQQCKH